MSNTGVRFCADSLSLFYEYGEGRITVYAVFHVSQSPEKLLARL
jgi:hypothetical protein